MHDVEAVFVITPEFTHNGISLDAFSAGKSVYCEKPMELTVEECDEMIDASRESR